MHAGEGGVALTARQPTTVSWFCRLLTVGGRSPLPGTLPPTWSILLAVLLLILPLLLATGGDPTPEGANVFEPKKLRMEG